MDAIRGLIVFLLVLAAAAFIGGIALAAYYTLRDRANEMPSFPSRTVTGISGVLATNLGAVLGLSIAEIGEYAGALALDLAEMSGPTTIQVVASYLYIIGLVVAVVAWAIKGFSEDPGKVVPLLPELSRTFIGIIVGIAAVSLGIAVNGG